MSNISDDLSKAVAILRNEDVVAIPTETVYGLAGNIYSEKAIRKIFKVKQRPFFNPLIVHTYSIEQVEGLVTEFPEKARLLAETFWPGPLTLVLKKQSTVPDLVTAGKDTVAVRIPNHRLTLSLLEALPFPLAAPSANPFGCISPTKAEHVANYFDHTLKMVLEGGASKNGLESTIVGFENGDPVLYRLGTITVEDLTAVVGEIQIKNKENVAPDAPGMLARHYAPLTKTVLVKDVSEFVAAHPNKKIGVVMLSQPLTKLKAEVVKVLSEAGDLNEAASELYNSLHELDKLELDLIVAEVLPDYGLGKSINDRLRRATKSK